MGRISIGRQPAAQTNLSRHGHDISQSTKFTSAPFMLQPVYHHLLNAGDAVHVESNMFTRTQPVISAANAKVDFFVDWFFVPATMIYTNWSQVRYKTDDILSSSTLGFANDDTEKFLRSLWQNGDFPLVDFQSLLDGYFRNGSWTDGIIHADHRMENLVYLDENFESWGQSARRLLMMLQMNPDVINFMGRAIDNPANPPYMPPVFPIYLAAYHMIYQKAYRLQAINGYNSFISNLDWMRKNYKRYNDDANFTPDETSFNISDWLVQFLEMHYMPWQADYFTEVSNAPIISPGSFLNTDIDDFAKSVAGYFGKDSLWVDYTGRNVSLDVEKDLSEIYTFEPNNNVDSLLGLRTAFAFEKFLRVSQRATRDYEGQTLAHFGFKVPHDALHNISKIASFKSSLQIGEVIGTANTFDAQSGAGSPLGEIAGKGYSTMNGHKSKFTAPCDGVLMAVQYSIVRPNYTMTGVDKVNVIQSVRDLFIPEFDHLGKQPLFAYECMRPNGSLPQDNVHRNFDIVGWQWRFEQYKRKYDRSSDAFRPSFNNNSVNNYSSWTVTRRPYDAQVAHYGDLENGSSALYNMLGNPHVLDDLMVVPFHDVDDGFVEGRDYSETPWLFYQTDPFLHFLENHVTLVSVMSEYGEPTLGGI